jgi:hypothetical protein
MRHRKSERMMYIFYTQDDRVSRPGSLVWSKVNEVKIKDTTRYRSNQSELSAASGLGALEGHQATRSAYKKCVAC